MKEGHLSTNLLREGHPDFVICFIALCSPAPHLLRPEYTGQFHWYIRNDQLVSAKIEFDKQFELKVILKEP